MAYTGYCMAANGPRGYVSAVDMLTFTWSGIVLIGLTVSLALIGMTDSLDDLNQRITNLEKTGGNIYEVEIPIVEAVGEDKTL